MKSYRENNVLLPPIDEQPGTSTPKWHNPIPSPQATLHTPDAAAGQPTGPISIPAGPPEDNPVNPGAPINPPAENGRDVEAAMGGPRGPGSSTGSNADASDASPPDFGTESWLISGVEISGLAGRSATQDDRKAIAAAAIRALSDPIIHGSSQVRINYGNIFLRLRASVHISRKLPPHLSIHSSIATHLVMPDSDVTHSGTPNDGIPELDSPTCSLADMNTPKQPSNPFATSPAQSHTIPSRSSSGPAQTQMSGVSITNFKYNARSLSMPPNKDFNFMGYKL
ncbi:hypothetical protein F5Y10DRAFT_262044 [Nemania abortiva]|nr:hypothetical protein F5Y10DRAFT_262044 [Nemania abortiva]